MAASYEREGGGGVVGGVVDEAAHGGPIEAEGGPDEG